MGFAHPAFNNIGKCKTKLNAKQQRAKEEHEKWLRKQGLHTEQLAARKPNKGIRLQDSEVRSQPKHKTSDKVGNGFVKETNTYTGTKLLGIAVMHKSCLVPVFSKENATEIASMRR
jgi:hypothetical protein